MRRSISNDQDWEHVDDEDCWGVNYTEPTARIKGTIEAILHIWGGEKTEPDQDAITKSNPEKKKQKGFPCHKRRKILKFFKT